MNREKNEDLKTVLFLVTEFIQLFWFAVENGLPPILKAESSGNNLRFLSNQKDN